MRAIHATVFLLACVIGGSSASSWQADPASPSQAAQEVVALERGALERWLRADPQGYIDLYGPDVTYFDPGLEIRVDGLAGMERHLAPMRGARLPFTDARSEFLNPRVQQYGDIAVLTFNLVNHGRLNGQPSESVLARWNATEVYRRTPSGWRIVHSHWSYTKPNVRPAAI